MPVHVIQFPGKAEYGRAVTALAEVPRTRVGLPDFKMVVEDDHLKALDRAGIPYADLTKDARADEPPAPSSDKWPQAILAMAGKRQGTFERPSDSEQNAGEP